MASASNNSDTHTVEQQIQSHLHTSCCPHRPFPPIAPACPHSLRDLEVDSPEYNAKKSEVNLRSAQRLLHVCATHGGVYTKFGQHVASMNHILPKEYIETLQVLQDRNPRQDFSASREGNGKKTSPHFLAFTMIARLSVGPFATRICGLL